MTDAKAAGAAQIMAVRLRAEAGDPKAQFAMAFGMIVGREVPRDFPQALRLLELATRAEHSGALLLHASLAIMGLAIPRNYDEAFAYLKRAARAGDPRAVTQLAVLSDGNGAFNLDAWRAQPQVTQHADAPRIFTFKNFIPKNVCQWLIDMSLPGLGKAPVRHREGGLTISPDRISSAANWESLTGTPLIHLVNLRIASITGTPLLNQEPMSILRYARGEEYKPHFDFIVGQDAKAHSSETKLIGQRVGTFLIYLNDGYSGGETSFPRLNWRFKGEPGDAMFFWNVSAANDPEPQSLHAGLPVTEGEKWLMSKWIRSQQVPLWWPDTPMRDEA